MATAGAAIASAVVEEEPTSADTIMLPIVDVAHRQCARATVAGPTVAPPMPQQRTVTRPMALPILLRTAVRPIVAVADRMVADRMPAANTNSRYLAAHGTRSGGALQFRRFAFPRSFALEYGTNAHCVHFQDLPQKVTAFYASFTGSTG
jgi:hypothetical protein